MMPNKKLIFSYLLLILMGVGLFMWLFSGQNKYSVSPEMDTDSASVITVQETAAIDTAKDIEVIRAYYKFLKEDTSEWAEFKKQEHNYLTQTLIDKLAYYDDAVFFLYVH